jgi:hypothetical protein
VRVCEGSLNVSVRERVRVSVCERMRVPRSALVTSEPCALGGVWGRGQLSLCSFAPIFSDTTLFALYCLVKNPIKSV